MCANERYNRLEVDERGERKEKKTHPDIVVTTAGSESTLSVWLEVSGVDWRLAVVPLYQQWSCLHRDARRRRSVVIEKMAM